MSVLMSVSCHSTNMDYIHICVYMTCVVLAVIRWETKSSVPGRFGVPALVISGWHTHTYLNTHKCTQSLGLCLSLEKPVLIKQHHLNIELETCVSVIACVIFSCYLFSFNLTICIFVSFIPTCYTCCRVLVKLSLRDNLTLKHRKQQCKELLP